MTTIAGRLGLWRTLRNSSVAAIALAMITAAAFVASTTQIYASSIKILVNDDPITEYDITQRSRLNKATSGGQAGGGSRQRAIDELIDEKLKMQAASRLGISVAAAQVDEAFNSIASRVKLSPSQFSQALNQLGVNPQTLKKRLEADLSWRDVVRSRFNSSVNIRDRDIETALARKGEDVPLTTEELALQQVIFIIPKGSSPDFVRQRKRDAQAFRSRYTGCAGARALAKEFRDIVVKDTVRRNSSDLAPVTINSIKGVPIDGASTANETPNAIEVIGVCERTEVEDDSAVRKQVRAELMNEQGSRLSRRLLIDLKQNAAIEYR